jgi:galactokinase
MEIQERVISEFRRRYGESPAALVRAPGRVNLIGEHTDYNDGFVLPMAIDHAVWIALRPGPASHITVLALDMGEERTFGLADLDTPTRQGWIEYIKGTAWALAGAGHALQGWEGVMAGDVPVGAGLSSSAALELATARACAWVAGLEWDPAAMALLGQRAENKWVGVNCGIMDQMISAAGRRDQALLLDCRSLEFELAPLPTGYLVVVLDTGTRRGLVDSAYNERRAQCEGAARALGVGALRDATMDQLNAHSQSMDPVTLRRARHVIGENLRTLAAAKSMFADDAADLGRLMDASHVSLRDDFQVSSPALDVMVEEARLAHGCLGARMTGAGFGGCAVALVDHTCAESFTQGVTRAYQNRTGNEPAVYVCRATDGAAVIEPGDFGTD